MFELDGRSDMDSGKEGVSVTTTARLHMGFFDLNGGLGRRFGSIGVSLDQPATVLSAWRAPDITAEGAGSQRAIRIAKKLVKALNLEGGVNLRLAQAIPEHAGLGSGTQMSLAIGLALNKLYDLGLILEDVALLTERGARSGIGLGTFAAGGVVIDGGRGMQTLIPPVIARADFPDSWRIMLILDHSEAGLHGEKEIEAFRSLPEFSADIAAQMCRHVLMQALPALAEHDLATFGAAIRELQERTGDYFAPAQGGRYASPQVSGVLQLLSDDGVACFGQSSWGPTGFAVFPNQEVAEAMMRRLHTRFSHYTMLEFKVCKGRNEGGVLNEIHEN
jgi:beta-RFAP synthase